MQLLEAQSGVNRDATFSPTTGLHEPVPVPWFGSSNHHEQTLKFSDTNQPTLSNIITRYYPTVRSEDGDDGPFAPVDRVEHILRNKSRGIAE